MKREGVIALIICLMQLYEVHGIVAYDCGNTAANLTTLSLLTVDECDIPEQRVNASRVFVQLLQLNDFDNVHVLQCKVEIDRTVRRCGMHSHTSDVSNGKYSYIESISRSVCINMHKYGSYRLAGGTLIMGLKPNSTTTRPVTLSGQVEADGTCNGGSYSDPFGHWSYVVVLGVVKITLQDYTATVKVNTNRAILRSGTTCELSKGQCTDLDGGDTFWESLPQDSCKFNNYGLLYEGFATKIIDILNEQTQIAYSITTDNTIFALTSRGTFSVCGLVLTRTEHPKLIIYESKFQSSHFQKKPQSASNTDIFTYMNSKFVYVERHIRTQINDLYRNILQQQCTLEQKTLQNALAIATQSPDIFAYHVMKGPGYMAVLAGEVIHIVKCVAVEVKVAQQQNCYTQLPVVWDNNTYFMTPQTHILLKKGTQTTCNVLTPSMYHLDGAWYKLMPKPMESLPPTMMRPQTKPQWKYFNPGQLATSGIYSQEDLEKLRDHIMFPAERPAMVNTIIRGMMGEPTVMQGGSLSNLLDEASVEKIVTNAWTKIWSKFLIFGNVSAGIIGIYLCGRIIKLLLDTFIHGYALHSVYGWSVYLVGAIWDSLTHLLIHLGKRRETEVVKVTAPSHEGGGSGPVALTSRNYPESATPTPKIYPRSGNAEELQDSRPLLPPEEKTPFTFHLRE